MSPQQGLLTAAAIEARHQRRPVQLDLDRGITALLGWAHNNWDLQHLYYVIYRNIISVWLFLGNHQKSVDHDVPSETWQFLGIPVCEQTLLVGGAITILKHMSSSMGRIIPFIMEVMDFMSMFIYWYHLVL
jgi:hypothetical protein